MADGWEGTPRAVPQGVAHALCAPILVPHPSSNERPDEPRRGTLRAHWEHAPRSARDSDEKAPEKTISAPASHRRAGSRREQVGDSQGRGVEHGEQDPSRRAPEVIAPRQQVSW